MFTDDAVAGALTDAYEPSRAIAARLYEISVEDAVLRGLSIEVSNNLRRLRGQGRVDVSYNPHQHKQALYRKPQ